MTDVAILAASPRGVDLGRRLRQTLGTGSVIDATGAAAELLRKTWRRGRPMVCIMPLESVVRALGPLLRDQAAEPAVVVVDEAGKFVVSVLGDQPGDGNQLARQIASALGAIPVITATDTGLQTPAVDLIGRKWAWRIEDSANLARVAAAVAHGQPVGVYQDAGRPDWWQPFGVWPHHFERLTTWPTEARWQALLGISDRQLPPLPPELQDRVLIYRPPTLTVGVACRRGVAQAEIEACIAELFTRHQLSLASITALASTARRKNEDGLIDYAEDRQIPFLTYAADRLALVNPNPDQKDSRFRLARVCEPAAMLAAGVRELVVPKTVFRRVTLAVARRPMA
jgi:cobalt-precorrin 5A hydrolase